MPRIKNPRMINYCGCGCGKLAPSNKQYIYGHFVRAKANNGKKIVRSCGCGCSEKTTPGKFYLRGHYARVQHKDNKPHALCECGCGETVAPYRRFVYGHHARVQHKGKKQAALKRKQEHKVVSEARHIQQVQERKEKRRADYISWALQNKALTRYHWVKMSLEVFGDKCMICFSQNSCSVLHIEGVFHLVGGTNTLDNAFVACHECASMIEKDRVFSENMLKNINANAIDRFKQELYKAGAST